MEFIPLCLECDNYKNKDYCPYYQPIPYKIKNRETECVYFSEGKYELIGKEVAQEDGNSGSLTRSNRGNEKEA
jgi:hypothetical protein